MSGGSFEFVIVFYEPPKENLSLSRNRDSNFFSGYFPDCSGEKPPPPYNNPGTRDGPFTVASSDVLSQLDPKGLFDVQRRRVSCVLPNNSNGHAREFSGRIEGAISNYATKNKGGPLGNDHSGPRELGAPFGGVRTFCCSVGALFGDGDGITGVRRELRFENVLSLGNAGQAPSEDQHHQADDYVHHVGPIGAAATLLGGFGLWWVGLQIAFGGRRNGWRQWLGCLLLGGGLYLCLGPLLGLIPGFRFL